MKYLLRVLFILALYCGFSSVARANTLDFLDFHAGAVDPICNSAVTECGLGFTDIGQSIPVALSQAQCTVAGINPPLTGLPTDGTPFGCFLGENATGEAITSITLDFASIAGVTGCDTILPTGTSPSIFTTNTCTDLGAAGFALSFSGGAGVPDGGIFVILEEGVAPGDFAGTAVVASTPEPDSLLLLSTGTMMMGLYMAGRTRLFAFLKK